MSHEAEHVKFAAVDYPIEDLLVKRWSPYVLNPKPVLPQDLLRCLEAARWAASSYNEQPWSFIVAVRDDAEAFAKLLECLVEPNRVWAQHSGALMLTVISRHFRHNGKPNAMAEHDLGLAMGNFCAQATALGLSVHQMGGINRDHARAVYRIPETHAPLTAVSVGVPAAPETLPDLADRDRQPRIRRPLSDFVFQGDWGSSWDKTTR